MAKIGYIRVSSTDQNLDWQIVEMEKLDLDILFQDKMSGKNMNRPELQKMLDYVRKNDTIYFESLERLGRDYDEIKETVVSLKSKGVKVQFLDAPFLNFDTGNELLDKAMFDMFLSLLSYVAQNEREKIRSRQKQGVAIAKEKGIYKGRKTEYTHDSQNVQKRVIYFKILDLLEKGYSKTDIVKETGVSRRTVYNIIERNNKTK
ncbi:recombinase family protein [Enterococcus plantarum]|uniref:recombinase family protein n=1 Tax=Enterococcus TaxID=1350 RepID=UPI001A8E0C96|nr:recombinase family protein [Enterococcus plantarum]MBO0422684.1 recombinase family protein [Enterococcus plantarum]